MKPTIRGIAKHAQVSVTAVSRVINKQPDFSAVTEVRVKKPKEDLNIHPTLWYKLRSLIKHKPLAF